MFGKDSNSIKSVSINASLASRYSVIAELTSSADKFWALLTVGSEREMALKNTSNVLGWLGRPFIFGNSMFIKVHQMIVGWIVEYCSARLTHPGPLDKELLCLFLLSKCRKRDSGNGERCG